MASRCGHIRRRKCGVQHAHTVPHRVVVPSDGTTPGVCEALHAAEVLTSRRSAIMDQHLHQSGHGRYCVATACINHKLIRPSTGCKPHWLQAAPTLKYKQNQRRRNVRLNQLSLIQKRIRKTRCTRMPDKPNPMSPTQWDGCMARVDLSRDDRYPLRRKHKNQIRI